MEAKGLQFIGWLVGVLVAAIGKGGGSLGSCDLLVVVVAAYLVIGVCVGCVGARVFAWWVQGRVGVVHRWEKGEGVGFFLS